MVTEFVPNSPAPPNLFNPPSHEDLTPEAFWQEFGDVSGLTEEHFFNMWNTSADQIGTEYGYHNAVHPREMLWVVMGIADYMESKGISISRKVLIGGVLYHDAHYHEDHTALEYDSKEEYAAITFACDAPLYDYSEQEIDQTSVAIISTRLGEIPSTPEGLALVLADLWNVAADYNSDFVPKTLAFADETKQKTEAKGLSFDVQSFIKGSIIVLSEYLTCLQAQRVHNVDELILPAIKKIQKLFRENAELSKMTIDQLLNDLDNPIVAKLLNLTIHNTDNETD